MECLNCDGKTKVEDSICYAGSVYRRRKCLECGFAYWTEELEVIDHKIITEAQRYKKTQNKRKDKT